MAQASRWAKLPATFWQYRHRHMIDDIGRSSGFGSAGSMIMAR
jgi:hypothetical protein